MDDAASREDKLQLARKRLKKFQRGKSSAGVAASLPPAPAEASLTSRSEPTLSSPDEEAEDGEEEQTPLQQQPQLTSPSSVESLPADTAETAAALPTSPSAIHVQEYADEINAMRSQLLTERQAAADQAKDYQKVVARLKQQLADNQARLAGLDAQQQQHRQLDQQLGQLTAQHEQTQAKLDDFKRELSTAYSNVSTLQTDKAQLEAANAQLQRQLADSVDRRRQSDAGNSNAIAIAQLQADAKVMRQGAEEMRGLLMAKEQIIQQLSADARHHQAMEQQVVDMRVELDAQRDEVARLTDALSVQESSRLHAEELERKLTAAEQAQATLTAQLAATEQQAKTITAQLADASNAKVAAEEQAAAIADDLNAVKVKLERTTEELNTATVCANAASEKNEQVEQLTAKYDSLLAERDSTRRQVVELTAAIENEAQRRDSELAGVSAKVDELELALKAKTQEIENAKIQAKQDKLGALEQQRRELVEYAAAEFQQQTAILDDVFESLSSRLAPLKLGSYAEVDGDCIAQKLSLLVGSAVDRLLLLENNHKVMDESLRAAKTASSQAKSEAETFKLQADAAESELQKIKFLLAQSERESTTEVSELKRSNDLLQEEAVRVKRQLESALEKLEAQDSEVKKLNSDADAAKNALDQVRKDAAAESDQPKSRNDELLSEVSQLKQQAESMTAAIEQLEVQKAQALHSLASNADELKSQVAQLQEQLEKERAALVQLQSEKQAEIASLSRSNEQRIGQLQREVQNAKDALLKLQEISSADAVSLKSTCEQLEQHVTAYRQQAEVANTTLAQLQAEKGSEVARLNERAHQLSEQVQNYEQKLQIVNSDFTELEAAKDARVAALVSQCEDLSRQIDMLKEQAMYDQQSHHARLADAEDSLNALKSSKDTEIAALTATCAKLTADLSALESSAREQTKVFAETRDETRQSIIAVVEQIRMGNFSAALFAESDAATTQLWKCILDLRAESVESRDLLDQHESALAAAQSKLDSAQQTIADKQQRLSDALSCLEVTTADLDEAKRKIELTASELATATSMLASVQLQRDEMDQQIDQLIKKISSSEALQAGNLQSQLTSLNERHAEAMGTLKKERDELVAERNVLNEQLHSMASQLADMTTQWKQACHAYKDKVAAMDELKSAYANEKDKTKLAESRAVKLQETTEQLQAQLQQLRERSAASLEMMEHLLADEKDRNNELSSRLAGASSTAMPPAVSSDNNESNGMELAKSLQTNNELTELVKAATEQAESSFAAADQLRNQVKTLQADLDKERAQSVKIRAELEQTMLLQAMAVSRPTSPSKSPHGLALDDMAARISGSMMALVEKAKLGDAASKVAKNLAPKSSEDALQRENQALVDKCDKLEQCIADLRAKLTAVQLQSDLQSSDVFSPPPASTSTDELAEQAAKLEDSAARIVELSRELDEARTRHRTEISARDEAVSALQQELEQSRQQQQATMLVSPGEVPAMSPGEATTDEDPRLIEKEGELEQLRFAHNERQLYVEALEQQVRDSQHSVAQAEKTICLLNDELERRLQEISELRAEREPSTAVSATSRDQQPSKSPSRNSLADDNFESTLKATADTVHSIDELLRLSAHRTLPTPLVSIKEDDSNSQNIINLVEQVLTCVQDIKASSTAPSLQMPQTDVIRPFLERLMNELPAMLPANVAGTHSVVHTLSEQREREIVILRSALETVATSEASDAIDGRSKELISQLQQAWDHEVKSNDVLRQLLGEVRLKMDEMERNFTHQLETIRADAQRLQTISPNIVSVSGNNTTANGRIVVLQQKLEALERLNQDLELEVKSLQRTRRALEEQNEANLSLWERERSALTARLDRLSTNDHHDHDALNAMEERLVRLRNELQIRSSQAEKLVAEKRAIENMFTESLEKWNDEKQKWHDDTAALKVRNRAEKDGLLRRFEHRIAEYEAVHREQLQDIEELRRRREDSENVKATKRDGDNIAALKREVAALRAEQHSLNENLVQERRAHAKLLQSSEKQRDLFTQSVSSAANDRQLQAERERHHQHCRQLVSDISKLRFKYRREAGYRADLIYQKDYLLLIMSGLEANERSALKLISNLTHSPTKPAVKTFKMTPLHRLRMVGMAVLAMCRMRLLAQQWNERNIDVADPLSGHFGAVQSRDRTSPAKVQKKLNNERRQFYDSHGGVRQFHASNLDAEIVRMKTVERGRSRRN